MFSGRLLRHFRIVPGHHNYGNCRQRSILLESFEENGALSVRQTKIQHDGSGVKLPGLAHGPSTVSGPYRLIVMSAQNRAHSMPTIRDIIDDKDLRFHAYALQ